MVFGTRHTNQQLDDIVVNCNGIDVEVVKKVKYLGVMLDPELKFNEHVAYLKHKLIGRTKMLGKLRPLVGADTTLSLYKSLILPVLDYADVVYDCLSAKCCHKIQRIQNYALRIVHMAGYETSVRDMHIYSNITYLSDRRHSHTLNYVYKCRNGLVPDHIASQLQSVSDTHGVQTRAATREDLLVPAFHLDMTRRSFRYRGPFYWNLMDLGIRQSPSLNSFKHSIKKSDMFTITE